MALVFAIAFASLAAAFSLSGDHLSAANFSAFILYTPLAALLARQAAAGNAQRAAVFATIGVGVGLLTALWRADLLGLATYLQNTDRLRLSNTALILAALAATLGISSGTSRWRWLFLLGMPIATAIVLISGARTGLVSLPFILLVLALLLPRRRWIGAALAAGALAALAGVLALGIGNARLLAMGDTILQVLNSGSSSDNSVQGRLDLYRAGWAVFQQSPWVGYGWEQVMQVIVPYVDETQRWVLGLPHLHNEILQFAISGGLVAVAVCLSLLAAPIVIALRSSADSQRPARVNSTIVLTVAYVAMGTTDTMIGFELHTALYVALTAIILAWCRDPEPVAAPG